MSLKSDPYVISSMILLNVSGTPGIVTARIGSTADVSAGCPCARVVRISLRRWGTECCLRNGYHSRSSPMILWMLFCAVFTHFSRLFPHKIDSGNPITTFSVSSLHIIVAATKVKVLPSLISSATSAPGISASQTHLLTTNHMAQAWCAKTFVPGRPGKRIVVAWDTVRCWLAKWKGIQQPDCIIQTLMVKLVVGCIENSIHYWTHIIWIEDLLTIFHLLLSFPWTFVCFVFVLNDLFQSLWYRLGRWAHTPVHLKFISMFRISQTCNHWNEYLWMEYNEFYSFNQNLH